MKVFHRCCAIILMKNNKILLGLRADGQGWSMAGGKLEEGENYEMAVKRELQEEFNLLAKKNKCLGEVTSRAFVKGVETLVQPKIFFCEEFEGEPKPQLSEMDELRWFGLNELTSIQLFAPTKAVIEEYLDVLSIL
ncbi:NUDIX domain-containing protein [Crassaminicella profunda]|uniref:NUDIX domain-containing protein n=1 Tax=Crassaminicella profunda TaxID=1286698 RepID=UPI001CA6994A|nr:NUDIX hydrolase [Crassaminicella profunda]QZY54192.1 NUDIX hydrolase [Crassaminicella profunda]